MPTSPMLWRKWIAVAALLILVVIGWFWWRSRTHSVATQSVTPAVASCSLKTETVPADLKSVGDQLLATCTKEYPKELDLLSGQPKAVTIAFATNTGVAGTAQGTAITMDAGWFRQHPDDLGALVHELAYVVMAYPNGAAPWLTHGIADYTRYTSGYANSWSYAHCGPGSQHYSDGYWCAAALLTFMEKEHPGTVSALNTALRNGTYTDALIQQLTGTSLAEQWQRCLKSTCKGGRA